MLGYQSRSSPVLTRTHSPNNKNSKRGAVDERPIDDRIFRWRAVDLHSPRSRQARCIRHRALDVCHGRRRFRAAVGRDRGQRQRQCALRRDSEVRRKALSQYRRGNRPFTARSPRPPTPVLNTDATSHGSFDAVVRAPNSYSNTVDLIVADASSYQIVRYPGTYPTLYQTSTIVFDYKLLGGGSGPRKVTGLALDVAANLYAVSVGVPKEDAEEDAKPALWVLPFNPATGNYGAPVLIDNTFRGVKDPGLGEVVVANVAASAVGTKPPAWNQGDLILLLNAGSGGASVVRYSQQAIAGVLKNPSVPLSGPTSVLISSIPSQKPTGIDLWPADATHGVSLLLPTVSGLVMRFDSSTNAFTTNFASGLGSGLLKIKVGTYSTFPYAFVAQSTGGTAGTGRILQFGAPPAGGTNTMPVSSTSGSADHPVTIRRVSRC